MVNGKRSRDPTNLLIAQRVLISLGKQKRIHPGGGWGMIVVCYISLLKNLRSPDLIASVLTFACAGGRWKPHVTDEDIENIRIEQQHLNSKVFANLPNVESFTPADLPDLFGEEHRRSELAAR